MKGWLKQFCDFIVIFQDIIRFWLGKGVDGFRVGAAKYILEAAHLRDDPQVDPNKPPVSLTSVHLIKPNLTWCHCSLLTGTGCARPQMSASLVVAAVVLPLTQHGL